MTITQWYRGKPDAPAVLMAGSGEVVTFRQLEDRSNRAAQLFRHLGLRRGDRIAWMVENSAFFFELLWGAYRSGLIYVPVSTHLSADDTAYVLNDSDAKVFVTTGNYEELAAKSIDQTPSLEHRLIFRGSAPGFADWEDAVASMPEGPVKDQAAGVDMNYSSGTTGKPKGVERQPPNFRYGDTAAVDSRLASRFNFVEASRFLVPNPLYHSAPMRHSMLVQMLGGAVVVMERFDAEEVLKHIENYGVTHALFVPTMFVRMLNLPEDVRNRYDHGTLQLVTHAAAACPIPIKERMIEWWGPKITELYGSTEECGFTAITSAEWLSHKGSIGKPTVGKFHILDDAGLAVPTGSVGTIWVEGARPFRYYKDDVKTAASRNSLGWQTVGDNGYADADGYVYLTDRSAFTINSGGVKISPSEVEETLRNHPKVQDAAVFGIPDPEFGEQVKAVVQLCDPNDATPALASELIEFCRASISRIKAPKSIDFEVELPRNALGKLMKKELRARYRAASDSFVP